MFRSIFDHPQGDVFFSFTSVTKDKLIGFVVACLLYLLCFVLILCALPSLVVAVLCTATTKLGRARSNINTKHNKYNRHASTNLKFYL